ncbi:MAG: ArsR family transcriptional regulator [Candidatus Hydrogenedentes bacterium]|nr:ArsR family transcriptional regulator [Candidatus Hydrogenedentota bacterium]
MDLSPAQQKFVLHWGEMGTRWGINRTVAQIHALLYIVEEPMSAEDIAHTLSVARSNVSNSLRELLSWSIVKVVHVLGERKDYYTCDLDVWSMMRRIIEQRKQREIDPTIEALQECVEESKSSKSDSKYTRDRFDEVLDFFSSVHDWFLALDSMPTESVREFISITQKRQAPQRPKK